MGSWGTLSPKPLGFFAFLSIPQEAGLGGLRRPSLRYSSPLRRSGCFPAEPYPPGGHPEVYRSTAICQFSFHCSVKAASVSFIARKFSRQLRNPFKF